MDQIPDSMSLRAYAARRCVAHTAVNRAVKNGRLNKSVGRTPDGKPCILDPELADREWADNADHSKAPGYVREEADGPSSAEGMTLSEASAVEKHWRAKLAELKFKEAAGELVPAADMRRTLADEAMRAKTKLLGIPSRAKQQIPHLTVPDITAIEVLIREVLEEISGE